jgi:hypothetical protein
VGLQHTRAKTIRAFISKIEADRPHNGQPDMLLRQRVARAYGIKDNINLESKILLGEIANIVELEEVIRTFDLEEELRAEFLQHLNQLRSYLSPTHWDTDPSSWHAQITLIMRGLLHIDVAIRSSHAFQIPEESILEEAADKLEEALDELRQFETDEVVKKAKILQNIQLIIQFLRNSRSLPLDDAMDLLVSAIWGVAEFQKKSKKGGKFSILISALLFANSQISDIRELPDNLSYVGSVAASIASLANSLVPSDQKLLPYEPSVVALPAPKAPEIIRKVTK